MKFRIFIAVFLVLALSLTACAATGNAAGSTNQNTGNNGNSGSTGENHSDTTAGTQTGIITAEEAQTIALEHAGLSADEVTGLWSEYDLDDGVPEYEVEFRHGRWEYEYEIHAETGEIRSYDRDD